MTKGLKANLKGRSILEIGKELAVLSKKACQRMKESI